MSINGLIATMSVVRSVNTVVFLREWREELFPPPSLMFYVQEILIPQLWVAAIILMDNLPVHHAHVLRTAIEAAGAKVVFLPPYSPDKSAD